VWDVLQYSLNLVCSLQNALKGKTFTPDEDKNNFWHCFMAKNKEHFSVRSHKVFGNVSKDNRTKLTIYCLIKIMMSNQKNPITSWPTQ